MEHFRIENMIKGWFIGNFEPSLYKTNDVEVGFKQYPVGSEEASHYHKIATEFTLVVSGTVEMNGKQYTEGCIIVVQPEESTDFKALTDASTLVVKIPGASNDKYLSSEKEK